MSLICLSGESAVRKRRRKMKMWRWMCLIWLVKVKSDWRRFSPWILLHLAGIKGSSLTFNFLLSFCVIICWMEAEWLSSSQHEESFYFCCHPTRLSPQLSSECWNYWKETSSLFYSGPTVLMHLMLLLNKLGLLIWQTRGFSFLLWSQKHAEFSLLGCWLHALHNWNASSKQQLFVLLQQVRTQISELDFETWFCSELGVSSPV